MLDLGIKKLTHNIFYTLSRQSASALLQLFTVILIARTFGPEGNGQYYLALMLPQLLATFLSLGISPANIYFIGTGEVSVRIAWRTTLRLYFGLAFLGMLIGLASILALGAALFPGVDGDILFVGLLIFPVSLLLSLMSGVFQGLQIFKVFNLITLVPPVLTFGSVCLLWAVGINNIVWMLVAYLAALMASLTAGCVMLRTVISRTEESGTSTLSYSRKLLGYGYKAHLSNILAFVNYKADIYLVNFFIGPAAAGVFVIAVQLGERLWMLSQSVSTVIFPRLSELHGDEDRRRELTPFVSRLVFSVTCLGALLLGLVAYPLIVFVIGEQYHAAFQVLLVLLPGIVFSSISRLLANDIASRGRPELNMYSSLLVVIVNVVANIVLIPRFGLMGAALATTIAYSLNCALRILIYRMFNPIPVSQVLMPKMADFRRLWSEIRGTGRA